MKYYWCVNCGYHGSFAFYKSKDLKCEICEYIDLTELEEKEFKEWEINWKQIQDEDVFYKSKGKVNKFNKPVKETKIIGKTRKKENG